jgi:hypothetical protein
MLSAVGSALLLATTNILTQDVAPVPLLWVLPLALYLLSFVVVFARIQLYWRVVFHPLLVLALIAITIAIYRGTQMPMVSQIIVYLSALLIICTVLHGELAKSKPDTSALTSFYLMISVGGACGGLFDLSGDLGIPSRSDRMRVCGGDCTCDGSNLMAVR